MNLGNLWLANFPVPEPAARIWDRSRSFGWLREQGVAAEAGEERPRLIHGVASSEIVDRAGTIVDYKSLKKASRRFMKRRTRPMYWNHGWWIPIGRVLAMTPDDETKMHDFDGLIGRDFPVPVAAGTMRFSTQKFNVDELWSIIEQDLTTGDSIAFLADVEEGEKDKDTGEYAPDRLHVTDLLEISVVTIPANPDAEFSVGKALNDAMFVSMIEDALRSGLFRFDERTLDLETVTTNGNPLPTPTIKWGFADPPAGAAEGLDGRDCARILEALGNV